MEIGGGGHSSSSNANDEEKNDKTTLLTVPPVPGRLLRFPGSAIHGVPKPPTLWFQSRKEQEQQVTMDENCIKDCNNNDDDDNDDDHDDDDDDNDSSTEVRSVILFNAWLEEGPRGVTEDYISKGDMPDGIQLVNNDNDNDNTIKHDEEEKDIGDTSTAKIQQQQQQQQQQVSEWEEDYGPNCCDLWCRPREMWQDVTPSITSSSVMTDNTDNNSSNNNNKSDSVRMLVPLMGKQSRRLYPNRHVALSAPTKSLEIMALLLENKDNDDDDDNNNTTTTTNHAPLFLLKRTMTAMSDECSTCTHYCI